MAPLIQTKSADYSVAATDDIILVSATSNQTLPDCTGLTNNHSWRFKNVATSGNATVTITAGGSNTFYYLGTTTDTTVTLTDPDSGALVVCNKGSVLYVF